MEIKQQHKNGNLNDLIVLCLKLLLHKKLFKFKPYHDYFVKKYTVLVIITSNIVLNLVEKSY